MRFFWCTALIATVSLVAASAAADEQATPSSSYYLGRTDAGVVSSGGEGRHRIAVSSEARFVCLNVTTPGYCLGGLQLGFEFRYGNVHAGVLGTNGDGSDPYNVVTPFVAPYGGLELGTRYYYVAANRSNTIALGLALRGDADLIGLVPVVNRTSSYNHFFAFSNTYGLNGQLLISRHVSLVMRAGIGWSARALTSGYDYNHSGTVVGLAVDGSLGLQARF
jgi:hypothetical protein